MSLPNFLRYWWASASKRTLWSSCGLRRNLNTAKHCSLGVYSKSSNLFSDNTSRANEESAAVIGAGMALSSAHRF